MCQEQTYPSNATRRPHTQKLLNIHLWVKYANIHATSGISPINDVVRITVQR